jgi:processive 1,2-diacylglycerol beta-glucosyltransferase
MDKTLLVYASFGEGHKRAAVSLREFINAPCVDLLDFSQKFVKRLYRFLYIFGTEHLSWLWQLIFFLTKSSAGRKTTEKIQEFLFYPFFGYLRKNKPRVVITTHFFPLSFISSLKRELNAKVIAIVTDIRVHPLWFNEAVDLYFVACEETKQDLINLGISAHKIQCGYVALREGFLQEDNKDILINKFALNGRPSILCMSSLRGKFPCLEELVEHFKNDFNFFIIYGKNLKLKKYFEQLNLPSVKLFSSYEAIWEIFQLSSIIITKPGGLTIFEGMYKRKPFIFAHYILGQEKENMDLLIKYGIGKFVRSEQELVEAVKDYQKRIDTLSANYPIKLFDIRQPLKEALRQLLE